jgi:protein SCO1
MHRRWLVQALLASVAIAAAPCSSAWADDAPPLPGAEVVFSLSDDRGGPVTAKDLRGFWLVVFFGYTSCPDLCPTALFEIATALGAIGSLRSKVRAIFVSVDPERDTPARLRQYVNSFDPAITPLTGTADQIFEAAKHFGVTYFKTPTADGKDYSIAHSAFISVVGPEGGLVTRFTPEQTAEQIAAQLQKLLA